MGKCVIKERCMLVAIGAMSERVSIGSIFDHGSSGIFGRVTPFAKPLGALSFPTTKSRQPHNLVDWFP